MQTPTVWVQDGKYHIEKFIPQKNEINEEELFVAVVEQRLSSLKGEEIGRAFRANVDLLVNNAARNKRHLQVEDAGTLALEALVTRKQITIQERDRVYGEGFRAAQLDDNHQKLFDSIGGKNDPTRAVASAAEGVKRAEEVLFQIDSGKLKPKKPVAAKVGRRALEMSSNEKTGGFLSKPVSNSSGTLSVLIPAAFGKNADSVHLVGPDGKVIEEGRFTSFGDTGERAKYVFAKTGASYPKDVIVSINLKDGTTHEIPIPDPSQRYG